MTYVTLDCGLNLIRRAFDFDARRAVPCHFKAEVTLPGGDVVAVTGETREAALTELKNTLRARGLRGALRMP